MAEPTPPIHVTCIVHEAHERNLDELKGTTERHGTELSKRPTWPLMLIILGGILALWLAIFDRMAARIETVGASVQAIHDDIGDEFRSITLDIKELQTLVKQNGRKEQ